MLYLFKSWHVWLEWHDLEMVLYCLSHLFLDWVTCALIYKGNSLTLIVVFWVVTPRGHVGGCQRFEGMHHVLLQVEMTSPCRWRQYIGTSISEECHLNLKLEALHCYQHLRATCHRHLEGEVTTYLLCYMVSQPRRPRSTSSLSWEPQISKWSHLSLSRINWPLFMNLGISTVQLAAPTASSITNRMW